MHNPVLLKEAVDGLQVIKDGRYIDATFGEGGHTVEILKRGGKVLGIDLDERQIFNEREKLRLKLVQGNFKDIEEIGRKNNFFPVDGILLDLGLSMNQIENSGRGFSYHRLKEPLDMRIDLSQSVKASDLVNSLSVDELYETLAKYSAELNSRPVAQNIVFVRRLKRIETVGELIKIIDKAIGKSDRRVYQRIFQALRIVVNQELENLKKGLAGASMILKRNGRLVVITFHSLEDRIVKNFIRDNQLKQINKRVVRGENTIKFERSAKLRIISFN